jgi:hypothetical protein
MMEMLKRYTKAFVELEKENAKLVEVIRVWEKRWEELGKCCQGNILYPSSLGLFEKAFPIPEDDQFCKWL